jgi:Carboxypeptidase regulatory-like domain
MNSRSIVMLAILSLASTFALGQAEAGSIAGTVRDSSGAVVAGATVSAKNLATSAIRTAQTGNLGQYTIPGLTPGSYDVIVTSSGFASYQTRTEVAVGGTSTMDAQLSLTKESTTVEVVQRVERQ